MTPRRFGARLPVLPALIVVTALTGSAHATRVPANCNGNGVRVNLSRSVPQAVNGQTVTYSISISNNDDSSIGLIACDATNVLVDFYCPGPDGSPNLANPILVANLADLPPKAEGTVSTSLGSKTCTINVLPGVSDAAASVIAGQQTGDATHACTLTTPCTQGTLHDSTADHAFRSDKTLGLAVLTCVAQVDKQISCDGGLTFHDVGLETADEDGHQDLCLSWNAHNGVPAENVSVRYVVANGGTADLLNCQLTDTNTGFPGAAVGNVAAVCAADSDCGAGGTCCTSGEPGGQPACTLDPAVGGHCVFRSSLSSATCSATLSAAEPDTATVTCDCTPTPGEVQKSAFDEANFQCQTPGLMVTKDCALRDVNGNSAVTIMVKNTGTADLQNCTVSDTNFTDAACPASGSPSGTSAAVAVTPSTIAGLTAGSMTTATGTATGLTKDSCNTASVTCEIKGSVDPNNPGHPKTLTGTAQDTCETCSVQIDKQISCGNAPCTSDADCATQTGDANAKCLSANAGQRCFVDVGFESNTEGGVHSCLGWNAFTVDGTSMPGEPVVVRYIANNTGGTALFSCTVTDTNTVLSSTAVSLGDVVTVSTPAEIDKTCSAELSAQEPNTATVSCFCTADKTANFLATAKDTAKFQCLTPGLSVTKTCLVPDANGNSEVDIELMNTGTADLANCVVTDNVFKNDPTCPPSGAPTPITVSGVTSLTHGTMTTVTGSVSGLTANACNTVSVTCDIVGSVDPAHPSQPKTLTATDSAICEVPSVKIEKVCVAQDANGVNQMTFKVTNTGGVALANCAITDNIFKNDPTCPPTGAGTAVPTTPATIASLDPGAVASATGSVSGLTGNACDQVSVTCDVVGATGTTVTANDEQVCLAAPPPSGCRVTGGGLVDACGPDLPGGDAPTHCGDQASDALDATHGGQVGAPVGVATAFTPDSACIQGEWQHVRHIRPKLYGNFHASTFDSLNCACLPCAGDPGSGTVTDGLCNPGDRICGPEPRRAPDNAICFSGVGDYALTNGNRAARSVVFRVDVQDHSEPGGTNGPPPPDRYRLRLWFLKGADPNSADAVSLRTAVACAHAGVEDVSATTPDIDDGGDLIRGNQQIHPQLPGTSRCVP